MTENKSMLGTEPIGKLLFKLAVPTVVAQLINMLYNIVDRMFIGRIQQGATLAMSGLGLCLPIISIMMAFANLCGGGGAPLTSIARGKGDLDEAEEVCMQNFRIAISKNLADIQCFGSTDVDALYNQQF